MLLMVGEDVLEAEDEVEGAKEFLRLLEDTVEERLKSVKCFVLNGEKKI